MVRPNSKTNSSIGSINIPGNRKSQNQSLKTSSSDMTRSSINQDDQEDSDRFFVVPRGVVVEYGPYSFHGVCDFRHERLQGIQQQLEKLGARVKMVACTDFLNRIQVWYMDTVIFTCKVTDLQHGGDGELDKFCTDAARAFDRASRQAIQGLRHRISVETKELLDPFCPCLNPQEGDQASNEEEDEEEEDEEVDLAEEFVEKVPKTKAEALAAIAKVIRKSRIN